MLSNDETSSMDLTNKRILVTGADGFIGSHLTERLLARGLQPRAFVQYNSLGSWGWLDTLEDRVRRDLDVVAGDIRDRTSVREAMKGCDVVLHLASLISIPYSYVAPQNYVDTNIGGTLNVLEAARDLAVLRLVHTSTSEVYGTARFVPITEEHPLQGQSPYAATKIGADQLALSYHRSFDLHVAVLRPFNTYGPRQSTRAVIPAILSQIASGGARIELGNLEATRDFTFVTDTAEGFILAAAADACVGEVTNIGSGFEVSIGDVARMISQAVGRELEIVQDPRRLRPARSEVDRLFAGIEKAERLFGWSPEHRGLDGFRAGLAKTVQWFLNPDNRVRYPDHKFNV
jgi:NAD dependent epimerase/dehydratase